MNRTGFPSLITTRLQWFMTNCHNPWLWVSVNYSFLQGSILKMKNNPDNMTTLSLSNKSDVVLTTASRQWNTCIYLSLCGIILFMSWANNSESPHKLYIVHLAPDLEYLLDFVEFHKEWIHPLWIYSTEIFKCGCVDFLYSWFQTAHLPLCIAKMKTDSQ